MKRLYGLCCAAVLVACSPASDESAGKPRVTASFYPLAHFASQVGKDLALVTQIASAGSDPHTYEPAAKQLQNIFASDIFIMNGAGQDTWAQRILPELRTQGVSIVTATESTPEILIDSETEEDHEEEEGHGTTDPHVWLDPVIAQKIVTDIAKKLSESDPNNAKIYASNADAYVRELRLLDGDYKAGLKNCSGDTIIVSHDAFGYLAKRYGFEALHIAGFSPSREPSPAKLAELIDIAKEKNISVIFFETHAGSKLSETLAEEAGAKTLVLHSLEALTAEEEAQGETYVSLMRTNLNNLRLALKCPK